MKIGWYEFDEESYDYVSITGMGRWTSSGPGDGLSLPGSTLTVRYEKTPKIMICMKALNL